jgi:hypothetical protein
MYSTRFITNSLVLGVRTFKSFAFALILSWVKSSNLNPNNIK